MQPLAAAQLQSGLALWPVSLRAVQLDVVFSLLWKRWLPAKEKPPSEMILA